FLGPPRSPLSSPPLRPSSSPSLVASAALPPLRRCLPARSCGILVRRSGEAPSGSDGGRCPAHRRTSSPGMPQLAVVGPRLELRAGAGSPDPWPCLGLTSAVEDALGSARSRPQQLRCRPLPVRRMLPDATVVAASSTAAGRYHNA
ncbi:unnamed protein product, partial [Urochloa humidicola]